jgi:hypothetical protein
VRKCLTITIFTETTGCDGRSPRGAERAISISDEFAGSKIFGPKQINCGLSREAASDR